MQNKSCSLKSKLGYDHVFTMDCKGRSGGLILMWKLDIQVDIQNSSRKHINAVVKLSHNARPWKFIGFYGF
jgi:hypothetical protein